MLAGEETHKETLVLALLHKIMLSHLQNDFVKKTKAIWRCTNYICVCVCVFIYTKTESSLQTQFFLNWNIIASVHYLIVFQYPLFVFIYIYQLLLFVLDVYNYNEGELWRQKKKKNNSTNSLKYF
jgi:hypothetical protein